MAVSNATRNNWHCLPIAGMYHVCNNLVLALRDVACLCRPWFAGRRGVFRHILVQIHFSGDRNRCGYLRKSGCSISASGKVYKHIFTAFSDAVRPHAGALFLASLTLILVRLVCCERSLQALGERRPVAWIREGKRDVERPFWRFVMVGASTASHLQAHLSNRLLLRQRRVAGNTYLRHSLNAKESLHQRCGFPCRCTRGSFFGFEFTYEQHGEFIGLLLNCCPIIATMESAENLEEILC